MSYRTGHARARIGAAFARAALALAAPAAHAQSDASWTRDDLVRAALADPSFDAFEARADAATSRSTAAAHARPPLVLDAQVAALPIETRQGAQWWSIGAAQRLPNRAARDAGRDAFEATATAALEARDAALIERAWRIDQTLVAIARAEAHIALIDDRIALLDAQHRWAADVTAHLGGDAGIDTSGLTRLALRHAILADRRQALREQVAAHHATLRALTGQNVRAVADGPWTAPDGPEFTAHTMPAPLGHEPMERSLLAQARAAEARATAADVSDRVTPTLSLRWSGIVAYDMPGAEPGRDALMLGVALPIPTTARARLAEASAARADADAARQQALAHGIEHDAAWDASVVRWNDALARLERAETELMPLADDAVRSLEPRLAVDATMFDRWLSALEQAFDVRALAIDARFDAALERARARQLAALELDTLQTWRDDVRDREVQP